MSLPQFQLKWSHCVRCKIINRIIFVAHPNTENCLPSNTHCSNPIELAGKAAQWIFVKCSWIMMKLILQCAYERKRETHPLGHSYRKSVIPLLSLLLFFIRSTKIQSIPKHCGNPRTLHYHIPIFPQTWSLSEYLLWLTIIALIKAKHFLILGLIYCFFSWNGFCQPFEH